MSALQPIRIAILGAESTGKSSLAAALAAHYGTVWVPEYLREFVDTHGRTPHEGEQLQIAMVQLEKEEHAAQAANRFLFCDTTPLMTALYSCHYFGRADGELEALANRHAYQFTLVTAPDSPWTPDGLQRESESVRQSIHATLIATLETKKIAYSLLNGDLTNRVRQAEQLLSMQASTL